MRTLSSPCLCSIFFRPQGLTNMPPKGKRAPKEEEDLDALLADFQAKVAARASAAPAPPPPPPALGTPAERRRRRKDLQARGEHGEQEDHCPNCQSLTMRLMRSLGAPYERGAFTCNLCKKFGNASNGVWHCLTCQYDAHPQCLAARKELAFQMQMHEHAHGHGGGCGHDHGHGGHGHSHGEPLDHHEGHAHGHAHVHDHPGPCGASSSPSAAPEDAGRSPTEPPVAPA